MRTTLRCLLNGHRPSKVDFVYTAPSAWAPSRVLRPCTRRGCDSWVEVERV